MLKHRRRQTTGLLHALECSRRERERHEQVAVAVGQGEPDGVIDQQVPLPTHLRDVFRGHHQDGDAEHNAAKAHKVGKQIQRALKNDTAQQTAREPVEQLLVVWQREQVRIPYRVRLEARNGSDRVGLGRRLLRWPLRRCALGLDSVAPQRAAHRRPLGPRAAAGRRRIPRRCSALTWCARCRMIVLRFAGIRLGQQRQTRRRRAFCVGRRISLAGARRAASAVGRAARHGGRHPCRWSVRAHIRAVRPRARGGFRVLAIGPALQGDHGDTELSRVVLQQTHLGAHIDARRAQQIIQV
eukprot:ctg_1650.g451